MSISTAEEFRIAIEQAGLPPPDEVIADGKIHRFQTNGRTDDKSGWYVLHADAMPAGAFGCWRADIRETWSARTESGMTTKERKAHRQRIDALLRQHEEEQRKIHADAACRADALWQHAEPASAMHPYLARKQVQAHGLGVSDRDNCLVIPVLIKNQVASLQFIAPDGSKRFLPGGAVAGGYYLVNDRTTDTTTAIVCEGFATAASLFEATGHPVVMAFNAGNLLAVAHDLRATHPDSRILVCGDHDKSGVGQGKAKEAAIAVGGLAIIPDTEGEDWNDVHVRGGLKAVKQAIASATKPQPFIHPQKNTPHLHTLPALAKDPNILARFEQAVRVCGVVGESRCACTTYLALTSRLLADPVSIVVKGLSSSGSHSQHRWSYSSSRRPLLSV